VGRPQARPQGPKLKDLKVIVFMAAKGETQKLVLLPVDAELRPAVQSRSAS